MSTQTVTEKAAQLAAAIAPLAALLGGERVGAYLTALAGLTEALADAAAEGHMVLEADDLETVKGLLAVLRERNDRLAQQVAES